MSPKAIKWTIVGVVVLVLALIGSLMGNPETDSSPSSNQNRSTFTDSPSSNNEPSGADSGSIAFCPDRLEALGPFVQGVDPEYDPDMDWDGDGVSCE